MDGEVARNHLALAQYEMAYYKAYYKADHPATAMTALLET